MLGTILIILLVLFLIGGITPYGNRNSRPYYGYGYGFGGGGLGLVLIIILVLVLSGHI